MAGVDSYVVFFPRFTTLTAGSFTSVPLDVSKFGGVQLEAWRGVVLQGAEGVQVTLHVEESLDGMTWQTTMSSSCDLIDAGDYSSKFLSFGFRLRWFRVRIETANLYLVTVYVEGIMRAGGGGSREWLLPKPPAAANLPSVNIGASPPTVGSGRGGR